MHVSHRANLENRAALAARAELLRRQSARDHLVDFISYTKPNYRPAWFHYRIAEALERIERGETKRLMVFCPPRHGKSELVSRRFPAWFLGRHPLLEIISASYGEELSLDFGRDVRNVVASDEYRALFPHAGLSPDSSAKNRWHTTKGGGYMAVGVGTATTGRGADCLVIDDPVKGRAEAESETIRNSIWNWYRAVAYTRLQPGGSIILVLTRWHEQDLAGLILDAEAEEGGERWEKVVLNPMEYEGELWHESYPKETLQQIRRTIGEYDWASLYEQRPRPIGGSFFTESDLLVEGAAPETQGPMDYVFAIVDSAVKTGKEHDGLAVVYFGCTKRWPVPYPLQVLDWDYKQIEGAFLIDWLPTVFEQLEVFAKAHKALLGSGGVFIEDKQTGSVLLQQAAQKSFEQQASWPVTAIDSKLTQMGKSERAIDVSGQVYQGKVKLSQAAYNRVVTFKGHTKNHLLAQILRFHPGTLEDSADDLLDCFTYGIALSLGNRAGF